MSHFTRTQTTGTWTGGSYVTLVSDWASLDGKVFASVNGDKGGSWAPSSVLEIIGDIAAGYLNLTGPLQVAYGGSFKTTTGARFKIEGSTAWPKFAVGHSKRSRNILNTCLRYKAREMAYWKQILGVGTDAPFTGIQSPFCSYQAPGGTIFSPSFHLPLRVHDAGTFSKATFYFRVMTSRTKKPVVLPKFRIIRTDIDGTIVPLKSTASGADSLGYISPPAVTSGAEWYNDGALQSLVYTCDQNNVIDTSQYLYWAEVQEEVGASTPVGPVQFDGIGIVERKEDVTIVLTADRALTGALSGPLGALSTGTRVLLTGQTIAQQNGIWILNTAGAWSRAADLSSIGDFTPNFIVRALQSSTDVRPGFWQIQSPQQPSGGGTITDTVNGTAISFLRVGRTPSNRYGVNITASSPLRGNMYHSVVVTIDDIVDMRPQ